MLAMILAAAVNCASFHIDPVASQPLAVTAATHAPGSCHVRISHGYPIPDPTCTPGAVNPTVTAAVLKDPAFRTACVRDAATSEGRKEITYSWYGITPPANNRGPSQTCELDHLVSIGLGGADTLDNIWPQCGGPPGAAVGQRFFKVKDAHAELSLMRQVKAGADLRTIQTRIAQDWTQFITEPAP